MDINNELLIYKDDCGKIIIDVILKMKHCG